MLKSANHSTNGEKCKMVYNGHNGNMIGFKSQQAVNDFGFSIGDELKYTAYTDVEETEIFDSPTGNQIYTFQYDGWTPCPGSSSVIDIDSNTYNTVQIGDQCWMKENLKTTTYRNGTSIPNVTNNTTWGNLTTGAYAWYDNDVSWKYPYGALYNWFTTVDINGLCPTGWHVPTKDEWTDLTDFIGGPYTPHGNELKSCRQVNSPMGDDCNTTEYPRWNEDDIHYGTDDYGFSGLPAGDRSLNGSFNFIDSNAHWWSSIEYSSSGAWARYLGSYYGNLGESHLYKRNGFSVRCLRD